MNYLDSKFAERTVTKTSVKEKVNQRQSDLYHLVKKKGRINKFEAYQTLGLTPGVYERLHSPFIARFNLSIIYDKKTKDYIDTTVIQKEQETLI